MRFEKPQRIDNWGSLSLVWRERKIPTAGKATIRWPDGHEETVRLEAEKVSQTVSDHGKEYGVASELPVFRQAVHGLTLTIFLDQVEVAEILPD